MIVKFLCQWIINNLLVLSPKKDIIRLDVFLFVIYVAVFQYQNTITIIFRILSPVRKTIWTWETYIRKFENTLSGIVTSPVTGLYHRAYISMCGFSRYTLSLPYRTACFFVNGSGFSDLIDHLQWLCWIHIHWGIKFACYIFDYYSLFGIVKFVNLYKNSWFFRLLTWFYLEALVLLILLMFCNILYRSVFHIFTKDRLSGVFSGKSAKTMVL